MHGVPLLFFLGLPVFAQDDPPASEESSSEEGSAPAPVPLDQVAPVPLDSSEGETPPEGDPSAEEPAGDDASGEEAPEGEEPPASLDLSGAEDVPTLTDDQIDWLKPARHKLPQNPYGQTDYTAYALEWGQVQIGLGAINIGIAPRVQLGTIPLLDAIGSYNLQLKANPLRLGRWDQAILGSNYKLVSGDWSASWWKIGGMTSVQLLEPWSLHVGAPYSELEGDGVPDISSPLAASLMGTTVEELEAIEVAARQEGVSLEIARRIVNIRVATDVRFNRRDALVLQFSGAMWSKDMRDIGGVDLPPEVSAEIEKVEFLDAFFADQQTESVKASMAATHTTTLSYQATWKQLEMRLGLGYAPERPAAWLMQAYELSYHFGGKTRSEERRMNRGWRRTKNKTDAPKKRRSKS